MSRSGYYSWSSRIESERSKANKTLLVKIRKIFEASNTDYGSPRVYHSLLNAGECVGKSRVERLMRDNGLVGKAGRLYRRKAWIKSRYTRLPNLRVNEPVPTAINQQWVADVTYLRVNGQWRYLAVIMDMYSRKIVGWSLGRYRTGELVLSSLRKALSSRGEVPNLIFHSDRGSEYGADVVQEALRKRGVKPSMNRPGHMTDNIHIESFFQSLKTERIKGVEFKSESELRLTLSQYLDVYYNETRLHSSIGYRSPVEYERSAA